MPLIRDDDQERQERIDRLVKELADMQRSLTATNERAARIAKEVADLRTAKPNPQK
jgi:uncharacterized protein YoxC